jgi:hypothetical protein
MRLRDWSVVRDLDGNLGAKLFWGAPRTPFGQHDQARADSYR